MYLTNMIIVEILNHALKPQHAAGRLLVFMLCWILIICSSWAIWKWFEFPVTALREKLSTRLAASSGKGRSCL